MNKYKRRILASVIAGSGEKYLIRDEFLADIAAGSVDETLATPGPGTRNVVDTGTFLSISGGKIATADSMGVADPSLIYREAIARVAGRLGWGYTNWNARGYIGFGAAIIGTLNAASICVLSTEIVVYDTAPSWNLGAKTLNADYETLVALRLAGNFCFIKGTGYANLELLYIGDTDATATLYYGTADRVAGGDTTSWHTLKVPEKLWLPIPLASDGFGGVVGVTDGAGHAEGVTGGLGAGVGGLSWTDQVGTWAIGGGDKNCSALAGGIGICTVPTSTADLYIDVESTRTGSELGIVARYTDVNNYLRAYHDGVNVKLDEVVGGVPNNLITAADVIAAGGLMTLMVKAQTAWLAYDGTLTGTTAIIDAGLTAANAGLYSTDILNVFDNFRVYARGTSGEYDNFFR